MRALCTRERARVRSGASAASESGENSPHSQRALVLGLGNDILGDDGVGILVAREAGKRLPDADVIESGEAGLALLEIIEGYDTVVICDSVQTGRHPPGTVLTFGADDFRRVVAPSAHYAGLPEVLELGERLGAKLPSRLVVVAIEIAVPRTFSESLSPEVEASIPRATEKAVECCGLPSRHLDFGEQ